MFGLKKKKTQEMENEVAQKEVPTSDENAAEAVTEPEAEKPSEKAENPVQDRNQTEAKKELQGLEPIGTPLTRPVRVTLDTIVSGEEEQVKRTVYDCDRSVLITDTLVGAFRAGNQKDFQEKHAIHCVVSGFKDQAEPLQVLLDATAKYLQMLSGPENEDILHANAVKAAGIILGSCGVPSEHVHIEADEQFIEKMKNIGEKVKKETKTD